MRVTPINYYTNFYKSSPQKQQFFCSRYMFFKPAQAKIDYKVLAIDDSEYIVAKTQETQKPLTIKPDIVDTYLRDEKGKIDNEYLSVFCTTYDQMILKLKKHDYVMQDFYGGALANILSDKRNIFLVGVNDNVYDFNVHEQRKEKLEKLNELEQECRAVLEYEKQKPKNMEQEALEKTVVYMQMCKKTNGYTFSSNYEYCGGYMDRIKKADELHSIAKDYGIDIATPLIKYATDNPKDSCDMLLLQHLRDFYHSNNFDFSSIEQVSKFIIDTGKNRENHSWTIVDKMIKLSKHVPHNSPDFMFILNQCTSKKDKKFNEQSINCVLNMFKTLDESIDTVKVDYVPNYVYNYKQAEIQVVKDYFKAFNDEETGTLSSEATNPDFFCRNRMAMLNSKKNY